MKFKFSIFLTVMWYVVAQTALYSHFNGWVMNPWVRFNFYGFAWLGWTLVFPMAMLEEWLADRENTK